MMAEDRKAAVFHLLIRGISVLFAGCMIFILQGSFPVYAGGCDYYDLYGHHDLYQADVGYVTCETDGYYVLKCNYCDYSETFITEEAWGHSWYETGEWVDSTCVTSGWHKMRCSRCGEEMTFTLPLTDHKWAFAGGGQAATCQAEGWYVEECSVCGKERNVPIGKLDHEWVDNSYVPSTCIKQGYKEEVCYNCGQLRFTDLPLAAHTWESWKASVPATDHSKGIRVRKCSVCGKEETEEFYPDGTIYRGGPSGTQVQSAQQMLIDLGYLNDAADGKFGGKTENAVKTFQSEKGLKADGIGWPETLALLQSAWNEYVKNLHKTDIVTADADGYPPACLSAADEDGRTTVYLCAAHAALAHTEQVLSMDGMTEEIYAALEEDWTKALNDLYQTWEDSSHDENERETIRGLKEAFFKSLGQAPALNTEEDAAAFRLGRLKMACVRLCSLLGEESSQE